MVGSSSEFDALLGLCRNQHRRIILAALAHEERSLTLNDLTKTIANYNHHAPVIDVAEEDLTEIRLSLHHTHIPKLADRSLVKYDQERQLVAPTSQFDQLEPQLSAIIDADPDLEAPITL